MKTIGHQVKQWTDLLHKQRREEWEMMKAHAKIQEDNFKKIFDSVQIRQMKELEAFFARYGFMV